MHEAPVHSSRVGNGVISVDLGTILHVFQNDALQSLSRNIRHDGSANLTQIPVKDSLYDGFVLIGASPSTLARRVACMFFVAPPMKVSSASSSGSGPPSFDVAPKVLL